MSQCCRHLCHTLYFHPTSIRSCCSNLGGMIFQENPEYLDCENIKNRYKDLLSIFKKGIIPDFCSDCFELQENFDIENIKEVKIKNFYISNWLHCNAQCIYCIFNKTKHEKNTQLTESIKSSDTYDVLPFLKTLKEQNLLAPNPEVYITGGEPTVLKELPEIINFFRNEKAEFFQIYSSGILYSKEIHELLKDNHIHTELIISPDSGNSELYKKIKFVDKFNDVIDNLKKYNSEITNPYNRIISKYICIKNINDNKDDLKEFIDCMYKTGLKHIRLDVEYNYPDKMNSIIPSLFAFGQKYCQELGIITDINGIALYELKDI